MPRTYTLEQIEIYLQTQDGLGEAINNLNDDNMPSAKEELCPICDGRGYTWLEKVKGCDTCEGKGFLNCN